MRSVAIVEDHQLLAETLAVALNNRGVDAEVVALCEPADLLAALLEGRPQLVVLDLDLGDFGDSTWLIAPLAADGIRVLVLTGSGNRLRIAVALEQGAIGYQHKTVGFDELVGQIEKATTSDSALDSTAHAELLDALAQARIDRARLREPFSRLTERERDTLQALAHGRTVSEIAREWVLAEATVRTHVRSLLAKLRVPSQLAAVSLALRSGWIDSSARVLDGPPPAHPNRRATDIVTG